MVQTGGGSPLNRLHPINCMTADLDQMLREGTLELLPINPPTDNRTKRHLCFPDEDLRAAVERLVAHHALRSRLKSQAPSPPASGDRAFGQVNFRRMAANRRYL